MIPPVTWPAAPCAARQQSSGSPGQRQQRDVADLVRAGRAWGVDELVADRAVEVARKLLLQLHDTAPAVPPRFGEPVLRLQNVKELDRLARPRRAAQRFGHARSLAQPDFGT